MLVKFTSYPAYNPRIFVITPLKMYLACTRCKRGENKASLSNWLSQFLEEQLAKGIRLLCTGLG